MAESKSLSEDYLLKDVEEKVNVSTESEDKSADKEAVDAAPASPVTTDPVEPHVTTDPVEPPVTTDPVEPPVTTDPVEPPVTTVVSESDPEPADAAAEETVAATEKSDNELTEAPPVATKESPENADEENTVDETPEIKLETAPGDYRFPTTNQSRHCFTRYVEYHRCVAAKGEDASECDKFAKYYRSLCPGEWIDRWNEQRENGTFPGPL